jgi:glycosyltransferase 2 family protein
MTKWLKLAARLLLSITAAYILYQKVDFQKVRLILTNANIVLLILAFIIFFLSKIISAVRLNLFFSSKNLFMPQILNAKLYLLGMFYNLFVPGLGGDAYKVYWLNKHYKLKVKGLIWATLLDRISGLAALTTLAILFFSLSSFKIDYEILTLSLVPIMYLIYYMVTRFFFTSFIAIFHKANIYSFLVQITQVACVYLILVSLGLMQRQIDYVLIFLISCYAYLIPVVGFRELAFVWGAQQLGLDMEISLSISLLFYLSMAVTSLSGVLFVLFPEELKPGEGRYFEQ